MGEYPLLPPVYILRACIYSETRPFSIKGKLNGLAVRVPLTNSSITDCVFEVSRPTTVAEVNALMKVSLLSTRPCYCLISRCSFEPVGLKDTQGTLSPPSPFHYPLTLPLRMLKVLVILSSNHLKSCMQEASETYLSGILGFEERPLVSTDYVNDARSSIVDAACTQVRLIGTCFTH